MKSSLKLITIFFAGVFVSSIALFFLFLMGLISYGASIFYIMVALPSLSVFASFLFYSNVKNIEPRHKWLKLVGSMVVNIAILLLYFINKFYLVIANQELSLWAMTIFLVALSSLIFCWDELK